MRRPARLLAPLTALLVWAGVGTAQTAPLAFPPPTPTTAAPGEVVLPADETAVLSAGTLRMDLLLGLPTGLRLQPTLGDKASSPWVGEVFLGADLILPMAGVGVRRRFTPLEGRRDCLRISPGIDAYILYWPGSSGELFSSRPATVGFITADVDIVWEHVWGKSFGTELGLKLGAGPAFGRSDSSIVLPVVSVFAGFRF